jgi:D-serine dehydratase
MHIEALLSSPIDSTTKGMPRLAVPLTLGEVGKQGWNVLREDMRLPLAALKETGLEHNSRWMRAFLQTTGVALAPHGKTTMSPQLFARQLADGAWGLTCANVAQLQVYRAFGVERVLFANQLVGRGAIDYVLDEIDRDPNFDFYGFVDSLDGVSQLASAAAGRTLRRPLRLLVEVGQHGGRTGVRTLAEAIAVGRAVAASPALALCGVASFEGVFSGDDRAVDAQVNALFDLQAEAARSLTELFSRDLPTILTSGGSQFPDIAAKRLSAIDLGRPREVVIRSGCYLTHDSGHYAQASTQMLERAPALMARAGRLVPALELWAYVQSRPEKTLALANFGKRDAGADLGLPVPKAWYRPGLHTGPAAVPAAHRVVKLNDQHAYLEVPAESPLRVGDMMAFGISHPCTTFDKWQVIPIVNDAYDVQDAVRTFF